MGIREILGKEAVVKILKEQIHAGNEILKAWIYAENGPRSYGKIEQYPPLRALDRARSG